jgi:hypothetical protein
VLLKAISRLRANKMIPRVMEKTAQRKLMARLRAINRLRASQQSMRES